MICPYSLRAIKNASVSTPLTWDQLQKGLKPELFNVFSVAEIMSSAWDGFFEHKQKLDV